MKKKIAISCIAAAVALCLIFALLLPACSKKKANDETQSTSESESGTLDAGTHQSPAGSDGQDSSDTTEETTTAPTEESSESDTSETEGETPPEPTPSLLYFSYGDGTCSVIGIGTYTDQSVIIPAKSPSGDIVTAIEAKAFYENDNIRTVQIPSTVTSIGNMAFGGCSGLVYIIVDSTNRAYCDINGVLYTADRTTLVTYPAANQSTTLELSPKLTSIADMALYKCENLNTIVFNGSPAEWEKLQIGTMNYTLFSASVTFTDNGK